METLVLIGASLVDGSGAEPVRGRVVVVEGDRITQVVDDARAPRGRRIDLSGCTLRPGRRAQGSAGAAQGGADVIKLIATGGVMTPGVEPGSPQLTFEEMRAAIEEATKAGRRTAAHAQGSTGIADAIEAGITTIEHGITDEIIASMKAKGVFLVPTLAVPAAICGGGLAAAIPEVMVRSSETVAAHHLASFQRAT